MMSTFQSLVENLNPVSADWKQLGVYLGFDMNELEGIQKDESNVADRFHSLCAKWFQRKPSDTWDNVIVALRRMNRDDIVEKIQENLGNTNNSAIKPSDPQNPKSNLTPAHSDIPVNVPRSVVSEVGRLQMKFVRIVCDIQVNLKHKNLSPKRLECLAVFISNVLCLRDCLKVDQDSKDKIHSLFISIEQHLNFFDTSLVCGIDVSFLDCRLEDDIDEYNDDVAVFEKSTVIVDFKNAIEECAHNLDGNSETSVRIVLKLDRCWPKRTLQNLRHLIDHLFSNAALLRLISIHESILTIAYSAPKSLLLYLVVLACRKRVGAFFAGVVSIQISEILLEKSRDPEVLSCLRRYGNNPSPSEAILSTDELNLHMQEKSEVIKLLLLLGGDPDYGDRKTRLTPLFQAVTRNDWISLKILLRSKANPHVQIHDGCTPLYFACDIGYDRCAEKLLQYGADPNVQKSNGVTPLFIASQQGNPRCCTVVLRRGANPDLCKSDGCSPLYMASQDGRHECVKILLEYKADHNLRHLQDGDSPLIIASHEGHANCVQLLLEHEADPNATSKDNATALFCAASNGNNECVKLLLQYKADPNISRRSDNATPLNMAAQESHNGCILYLLLEGANPNCQMKHGGKITIPLFHAIVFDSLEGVKLLLNFGADPNLPGTKKMISLHFAIIYGNPRHVELLLTNPNAQANPDAQDDEGNTPLMFASEREALASTKLLLHHQANPNIKNKHGITALIRAVIKEHYGIVHLLLENKADPNGSDFLFNALDFACWSGNASVTALLIDNGANTHRLPNQSLLMKAITNSHHDVAKVLIEAEVDINVEDESGSTPILHASFLGQLEIVEMLADAGADLAAENRIGYTAFDMAELRGHHNIMEILADKIYSKLQEASATKQSQLSNEVLLNQINRTISQFKFKDGPQSIMQKYRLPDSDVLL